MTRRNLSPEEARAWARVANALTVLYTRLQVEKDIFEPGERAPLRALVRPALPPHP